MDARDDRMRARDVWRSLRRQWALILAVALATVAAVAAATASQRPSYTASSELALENPASTSEARRLLFGENDLGTQQRILNSEALAREVLARAGRSNTPADVQAFSDRQLRVLNEPGTNVITLTVRATEPQLAARLAQGMAEGYLAYVEELAGQRLERSLASLRGEEVSVRQELASVQQELSATPAPEIAESLERDRDQLYAQLRFLATQATDLRTTNALAAPATIIEPAIVPGKPSSPNWLLNLAAGVVFGALLAVAVAVLRGVLADRVWDERALESTGAAEVLGTLHASAVGGDDPQVRRLRSRFAARVPGPGAVTALVPVGDQGDAAAVGARLAQSLARAGRRVAVVDADVVEARLSRMLGLTGRGLSDVLPAEPTLELRQLAEAVDGFLVVRAGDRTRDVDLLAGDVVAKLLQQLRGAHDHVLLVGSSAGTGTELASVADATVLVLGPGTARKELATVVDEVHAVQRRVTGLVIGPAYQSARTATGRSGAGRAALPLREEAGAAR